MSYKSEFPDYDEDLTQYLAAVPGFEDRSWHNDICPRFESEDLGYVIWLDYKNTELREYSDHYKRFTLSKYDDAELYVDVFSADNWDDIVKEVEEIQKQKLQAPSGAQ